MQEVDEERGSEVSHELNPYSEFKPEVEAADCLAVPRAAPNKFDGDAWKNSFILSHGETESEEMEYDIAKHNLVMDLDLDSKSKNN